MDKSWMNLNDRDSEAYANGVEQFLDFAHANTIDSRIFCPCKDCLNRYMKSRKFVKRHLLMRGIMRHYNNWTYHGEPYTSVHHDEDSFGENVPQRDDMIGMVYEALDFNSNRDNQTRNGSGPDDETAIFLKFLQDAEQPVYPRCEEFTSLSFIVHLLNLKVISGWTNKSFTMLLKTRR
ncbi:hypothetical protein Scep_016545 [Stephania cephalantha]|uniref:Transposase-associated domain-containing protein n=1 Tax=Stephania cephalantha TaxID=152367 RepID=A0AAP0IN10_9MAGN